MSDDINNRLNAILTEKEHLHSEKLEMQKSIHKSVLAALSIGGVAAGLLWNPALIQDMTVRSRIIFLLTQVEFILALFALSLFASVGTIAAYIGAQEELINSLLGTSTNVYESKVAATFFWQPKGALFWTTLAIIVFFFCCFVVLTWLAYDSLNTFGGGALLAGELIILGILALWIIIGQGSVRTRIRTELGIRK